MEGTWLRLLLAKAKKRNSAKAVSVAVIDGSAGVAETHLVSGISMDGDTQAHTDRKSRDNVRPLTVKLLTLAACRSKST